MEARKEMQGTSQPTTHGGETDTRHDRELPNVDLLAPLKLRGVTIRNRIAMSPMCQYSAEEGFAHDWHLVHLGSRAIGGCGLVMVEATAVTRDGRISPGDVGLWTDEHAEPLARIATFLKRHGAVAAIQLAHAGRKASCDVPWNGGRALSIAEGGWPVVGPSAVPFDETSPVPRELDAKGIEQIVAAFEAAARRALAAGFEVIEIHSAHGYLLHEFLSPISNRRTDEFGGSFENRARLLLTIAKRLRAIVPDDLPIFTRISATDWVEGGWDLAESIQLAARLKSEGIDLIDVSSGGTTPHARIPVAKGYQVNFARAIRDEAKIATGAVGLITEPAQANDIITGGDADLVFIGRELLREPYWAHKAVQQLDSEPAWPTPYGYAVKRRVKG